jgi:hypothetical protein
MVSVPPLNAGYQKSLARMDSTPFRLRTSTDSAGTTGGWLALELRAARVSGWLSNEAPAGWGSVTVWFERGEQHLH